MMDVPIVISRPETMFTHSSTITRSGNHSSTLGILIMNHQSIKAAFRYYIKSTAAHISNYNDHQCLPTEQVGRQAHMIWCKDEVSRVGPITPWPILNGTPTYSLSIHLTAAFLVQAHQEGRCCRQVRNPLRFLSAQANQEDRNHPARQIYLLLLWTCTRVPLVALVLM